jgi:CheY-specific phosphatase CheX
MREDIQPLLEAATAEVLETMFFATASGEAASWPPAAGDCVAASVAFSGTRNGNLTVRLPGGTARALAACFLGVDSEGPLGPGQVAEVVCEMANMVCGAALSRLDPDGEVRLGPPGPAGAGAPPPGAVETVIAVDEGPVAVTLAICR